MDFFKILQKSPKKGVLHIFPDFRVLRSKDLMIRGKSFYAIWDEDRGLWSTDEFDVQRLVDKELYEYSKVVTNRVGDDVDIEVKYMGDFSSNSWAQFRKYLGLLTDNAHQLDEKLTFANTDYKRTDYVSKKLPYPLEQGSIDAWDTFMSTAYDPEEREKIEWAIGAIVAGEAKNIQKFLVIYGEAGSGKSTVLNVIQKLFDGYYTTFESKALGSMNNAFATEAFRGNPLVAIEHDGDLSRLEDNTKLNSLVSHEEMTMNEKYKPNYTSRSNAFVIMGTNKPVRITDGKSGLLRRLIDVNTSGRTLPIHQYQAIVSRMDFELGAIAYHCLDVFRKLGPDRYLSYKPTRMQFETDIFFNFVEDKFYVFKQQDGTTLTQAWDMYKQFCEETSVEYRLPRHKFRAELKNYFRDFREVGRNVDGKQMRSVFAGFIVDKFTSYIKPEQEEPFSLSLTHTESLLDLELKDQPAQYSVGDDGAPKQKWANVTTTLSDIDTTQLHYVVLPENHIVIDFDLKDDNGEKSAELNLEAANKWPPTYAEFSKSGKGIHLHYFYDGDPNKLANLHSPGIEVFRTIVGEKGPKALRRRLSKCNNIPISHISSGLPLKGEKVVIDAKAVSSEKGLRELIIRNLNKEIHPGTKPSIDFIHKILEDAYKSGLKYDVSQLFPAVLAFANNSTNHADYCVKLVSKMKFQSEEKEEEPLPENYANDDLVFYDVEVFPNLFIVCWKFQGPDQTCVHMINPTPSDMEDLFKLKLVGFNNRRYDNHILYARYLGYDNARLFEVSSKITSNESQNGYFREAYNVSYTDIYDFASAANKKSLKKWEIELGIHHQELGFPWDQPVPQELWTKVAEYCENDVVAEEVVFNHLSGDWAARKVIAELSGLTVNHTTNQHSTKIIFGDNKDTTKDLVYTDLSVMFPGYVYDSGKSTYRGEEVGEGGYVYSEPGMYGNVALLDVASMHPTSIEQLNLFGKYTKRFSDLKKARIAIKRNNREELKTLLDGRLMPYLDRADSGEFSLGDLSNGLKTVLNSAYGLTYAHHDNPFKDPRNVDNIVAKRGALFMVDLKHALQERGYQVVHIKTDSVKIADATKEAIDFVLDFGHKYGYDFEHEATYSKFCLVNDAVYIARYKDGKKAGKWTATGAEFAHSYVFKSLFSKEPIEFSDLCEDKSVTGKSALYLDMNENLEEGEHNYLFVGRVGLFCPVEPGTGGGLLMREKEGKYYAATGSKGYRWLEAEIVKDLGISDQIDTTYHESLVADAIEHISKFGDFDKFVSEES
jgi:energy-coupling factor transporter ATP-binding protein EcfA2